MKESLEQYRARKTRERDAELKAVYAERAEAEKQRQEKAARERKEQEMRRSNPDAIRRASEEARRAFRR